MITPLTAPWLRIPWRDRAGLLAGDGQPRIMGIVNTTPDSFSDGGAFRDAERAVAQGSTLARDGAHILDIGGESSRPGALPVPEAEELARILPVVEQLAGAGLIVSIDTVKAAVARAALAQGARIINDISGLEADPAMTRLAAETGAAVVLMHMQGTPSTMQINPSYGDVVAEVYDYLARRAENVARQGVPRDHIALDPGIGFGKTNAHSLHLLRALPRFASLGHALVIGTSRKGLLGKLTGRPLEQRQAASTASALAAILNGAAIVRVHEAAPVADSLAVWRAQLDWPPLLEHDSP